MLKWCVILCWWMPSIVLGQESEKQKPLTIQEMLENDRFEWRTITFRQPSPPPRPIPVIQQAIEGRTSLVLHPQQQWVSYEPSAFQQYAFLHWEMCGSPPDLSLRDKLSFRDYFNTGGTLFLDTCEGSATPEEWQKWGSAIYPDTYWEELNSSHVLAFSFYLLEKRILLNRGHSAVYVLENDGRYIMILNHNPEFSWERFRQSAVSKNYNSPSDEMRLRLYINLMVYLLTGDYKADQLHLPTILLRRK